MSVFSIIISILELFFVSAIISIDNAVLIGALTKDLPSETKKRTNFIGAILGLILRLFLVGLFYFILNLCGHNNIPLIYIFGGLFIVLAGMLITSPKKQMKKKKIEAEAGVLKIIFVIFSVDAMLSFDNAIIIAEKGSNLSPNVTLWEILIMILATSISFPIVLYGSNLLGYFLNKWKILIYLASVFLIGIGVGMILEDPILKINWSNWLKNLLSYGTGVFLVSAKWFLYDKKLKN